jgi:exonuclease SbcD
MPTLLHTADFHIGIENYGHFNPRTGLHSRLEDYLQRLDEALNYALTEPVDLVVIAGDIYKNRTPNPTHQREFARRIKRVAQAGIPVFILTGNHDAPATSTRAHSIEIFDALQVEGVTIASRLSTHTINTQHGPIQMIAVPWINRQDLLTKDEMIGLPMNAIETEILRRVGEFVQSSLEQLDPVLPTVLAFHGTLAGASCSTERSIMLGQELVLPSSMLALPDIDYLALGHVHKHQALGTAPPAVYPGSLERIDFGEEEETKGFVIAEVEKGNTTWRFVPVAARPFVTIHVDVRDHQDANERIRRAIAPRDLHAAVARLIVQCSPAQRAKIDERAIHNQLKEQGVHHVAAIVLEVERPARGRFAGVAEQLRDGLTPRQALELYLQTKNIPPDRQARLLQAADGLLQDAANADD